MARPKERSEVEYLRSLIKGLKAENRYLKKEVARLDKRQHQYEDLEEKIKIVHEHEEEQHYNIRSKRNNCPNCLDGLLENIDLGVRTMIRCSSCNYRQVTK